MINIDKGQFPSQQAVYLGITVDTEMMLFILPEKKMSKIFEVITEVFSRRRVPVKLLARVVGMLQAGVRVLGQPVRVCMFALYRDIDTAPTWEWFMSHSPQAVE